LKILSSGALPPNPVELLNSPAMDAVFEKLQEEADIVIFDSPPILAAADGQVLASKMDGVLYVMQLGRIPRSALQRAMELLQQANAHVIGTVFNKVDEKEHQETYGGYGNYYYGLEEGEGGSPSVAPSLTSVLGRTAQDQDGNGAISNGTSNGTNNGTSNGVGHGASNGVPQNTTKTS
jgi:Mrp family chromosome partitioning ATPase